MKQLTFSSSLLLLVVACILATANSKFLIVYLDELPIIESKAFKDVHKEVMMKRDVNSNQRNVPLEKALSSNKNLKLQENKIRSQQDSFVSMLPDSWKIAEIARENGKTQKAVSYIASNSVVVDIGDSNVREAVMKLMFLPGVRRVEEEHKIKFDTFQSLDQIGATSVYNDLGMDELEIGGGIKIAVTDNGNYVNVPMMNDEGFSLPLVIPDDRGETSNINNKLIISRAYGTYDHSYQDENEDCHGIHTSSTTGGRRVNVTLYGHNYTLSGVAPGAWLMNYRFVGTGDAKINILTDDVIRDNPDISSNSWGPTIPIYNAKYSDFIHFDRMMDNNIFVSKSVGNHGPSALTAEASVEKAIVVGACTKEDTAYYELKVTGLEDPLICIASKQTLGIKDNYSLNILSDGYNDGCDSTLDDKFSTNDAVLLYNNNCGLYEKAVNIKKFGAGLMIIGEDNYFDYDTTVLPSIHCTKEDIDILVKHVKTTVHLTLKHEDITTQDKVAQFSSRGPTQDMKLVPDVVAPGVNVLAAGYGVEGDPRLGYNYISGTSMSAPFVSGAAAIIIQNHTEFSMEEIKSALMTTADFINVTRQEDGKPAQPLDMGAGRINLKRAINPTLYISPPKVDFSISQKPNKYSKTLKVHSYSNKEMNIQVDIVLHSGYNNITSAGSHLSAEPSEFTLSSTSDVDVVISLDTNDTDIGDQNAYVMFYNKATGEEIAHVPLWGQVTCPEDEKKDILLYVVNDGLCEGTVTENIADIYKSVLNKTGLSYDTQEYCDQTDYNFPEKAVWLGYRAVIIAVNKNPNHALSYMEDGIRRMMHAGVPVIQMGKTLPYAWDKCKFAFYEEFGINNINQLIDLEEAESDYLVGGTEIPKKVTFNDNTYFGTLLYDNNDKPIIVSAKDRSVTEEGKIINSIGITSFVGLEQINENYRDYVILFSFWHGLEKGCDIKTDLTVGDNVAVFNVSTLINYSSINGVQYKCSKDDTEITTDNSTFECVYDKPGEYEVSYWVYTSLINKFFYKKNAVIPEHFSNPSVIGLSSSSSSISSTSTSTSTSTSSSVASSGSSSKSENAKLLVIFSKLYLMFILMTLFMVIIN